MFMRHLHLIKSISIKRSSSANGLGKMQGLFMQYDEPGE